MYIPNFNNSDDIEITVIDLNNLNTETSLPIIECYGIVGMVNNEYMYSTKPQYLRQTYIKRLVSQYISPGYYIENIYKDESIYVNNFSEINDEGKILFYKRITNENWNFDRDGFIYNNGTKIININNESIYECLNPSHDWIGFESELIGGKCPDGHGVWKYLEQEKFKISPMPICKIPYIT